MGRMRSVSSAMGMNCSGWIGSRPRGSPAEQCLHPGGLAGVHLDHGLVVDGEFVPGERVAQVLGDARLVLLGGAHARFEHDRTVAALVLGDVEGEIRVAQRFGGWHQLPYRDDADAGRHVHGALAREREGVFEPAEKPLGVVADAVGRQVFHEYGELVPAQPGDGVLLTHPAQQPVGDRDQHFVTDRVAQAVVDVLEMVEVDQNQARGADGRRAAEDVLQPFGQQCPVGQARQRVVEGLMAELFLQRRLVAQGPLQGLGTRARLAGLALGVPGEEGDPQDQQQGQASDDGGDDPDVHGPVADITGVDDQQNRPHEGEQEEKHQTGAGQGRLAPLHQLWRSAEGRVQGGCTQEEVGGHPDGVGHLRCDRGAGRGQGGVIEAVGAERGAQPGGQQQEGRGARAGGEHQPGGHAQQHQVGDRIGQGDRQRQHGQLAEQVGGNDEDPGQRGGPQGDDARVQQARPAPTTALHRCQGDQARGEKGVGPQVERVGRGGEGHRCALELVDAEERVRCGVQGHPRGEQVPRSGRLRPLPEYRHQDCDGGRGRHHRGDQVADVGGDEEIDDDHHRTGCEIQPPCGLTTGPYLTVNLVHEPPMRRRTCGTRAPRLAWGRHRGVSGSIQGLKWSLPAKT